MTYNVFGGTLSLTQSINQSLVSSNHWKGPNSTFLFLAHLSRVICHQWGRHIMLPGSDNFLLQNDYCTILELLN